MSIDDLLEKGMRAQDQGELKTAQQLYQQVLEQQKSAEVWLLLAEVQIESGAYAKAHKSLSAGLQLEPENIDLLFSLGDLYLEEENLDKAIATYQTIIDLDQQEADAWVCKAVALMNRDDLKAAELTCRQALKIDPELAFAHNALGDICVAQNNIDAGTECFLEAIKLDSTDPQPYLSLAELYYDAKDLVLAEKYCLQGLELDAGLAPGYLTLGYIRLDQDRTQEALDNFQQFLRLEKSTAAKNIRDEVAAVIDGLK